MPRLFAVLAAAFFMAVPSQLNAWGDHGHRLIGLIAAQSLPQDMPAFFRDAAQRLSYLNPEPDRWKERTERSLDPALVDATSPEHYVNLDIIPASAMQSALRAPNRFAFADSLARHGVAASKAGLLPYQILELSQRLRVNFRLWRIAPDSTVRHWIEQRIIEDAGVLGHYIADASNPAHTTKHHNGWVGENPKGFTTDRRFHSRFESAFVQANVREQDVRPAVQSLPAAVHRDFRSAINSYLASSHGKLEQLYSIDTRTPFGEHRATAEQKQFAVDRLSAGAAMLRDIWYSAWVTSDRRQSR